MVKKSFWLEIEQADWVKDATKARNKKTKVTESSLVREIIDVYRAYLLKEGSLKKTK